MNNKKLSEIMSDNNYTYYVHKSSDYEDMSVEDKKNSYFSRGIINIKNKELYRSAVKVSIDKKENYCYNIDSAMNEKEQYESIFNDRFGLASKDYAVIIRTPKEDSDSIIIESENGYMIDPSYVVAVIYRKKDDYTDEVTYELSLNEKLKKEKENYFRVPSSFDLEDNYFRFPNENDLNRPKTR